MSPLGFIHFEQGDYYSLYSIACILLKSFFSQLVFQRPKTDECLEYVWPTLEKYLAEGWNNLSPERLEVLFVCKLQCPVSINYFVPIYKP